MKRQAEPASVEDVSDETNETIPDTRRSATSSEKVPTPKRQKTVGVLDCSKTKSATAAVICRSREPVSLTDAVRQHERPWPMTILSGRINQDVNANKIDGFRFRKLFYEGASPFNLTSFYRPISNETTTFIERDIFMTAEDAQERNPDIWIEQRTFNASGKQIFKARQLFFPDRVVHGNVYIFPGCGDQILGFEKLPDLHFTGRVLPREEWPQYISKTAKYYGYDNLVHIHPTQAQFNSGDGTTYSFDSAYDCPCSGMGVSARRLPKMSRSGQDLLVFDFKLKSLGPLIEDTGARADLDVRVHVPQEWLGQKGPPVESATGARTA